VISIDTSVVVRYLVGTPVEQARRVTALIDGGAEVAIPVLVLVETAHVLRTQYDLSRADILDVLVELLTRTNVTTLGLSRAEALAALVRARQLPGSPLPDALIAATARSFAALPLYTFDDGLRLHGVPVVEP
jgi:predicted nucleic acid-binding protein